MKKMRCLRAILIAALACGLAAGSMPVWAAAGNNLGDVNQEIDKTQAELSKVKRKENSALSKLMKTQRELDSSKSRLNSLNSQLQNSQISYERTVQLLAQAEEELGNIESRLSGVRGTLHGRMRAIYLYGPMTYVEMLLTSRDFSDFVSRFELIGYLIERDVDNIRRYEQVQDELQEKKIEIENRKKDIQRERERISNLQRQTAQQTALVSRKYQETRQDLNRIQQDRRELEKALQELERTSRELENELRKRGDGAKLGTGTFLLPVKGRISSPFGWRYHPILKRQNFHSGVDLAAPRGTAVLAADSGKVIFAGWKGGYGKTVIIDHGAGLTSLYAHNDALLVKEGDQVLKGQIIARVGSTGLSTGPHSHFEIRKNGAPVNPMSYIP